MKRHGGRRAELFGLSQQRRLQDRTPGDVRLRCEFGQPGQPDREPAQQVLPEQGVAKMSRAVVILPGKGGVETKQGCQMVGLGRRGGTCRPPKT